MRISDWSADVCSSDLLGPLDLQDRRRGIGPAFVRIRGDHAKLRQFQRAQVDLHLGELAPQPITLAAGQAPACEPICFEVAKVREPLFRQADAGDRSEERRVGKACGSTGRVGWSTELLQKKIEIKKQ